MRMIGRALAALLAVGFAASAYLYLSLPDVRTLRTRNPETTAFIELRLREARAKGLEPAARAAMGELRPHLAAT